MSILVHIADRLLGRPLLITPEKAEIVFDVLSGRLSLESEDAYAGVRRTLDKGETPLTPEASRFSAGSRLGDDGHGKLTQRRGGVATISIVGSLVNRGAWIGASSGLVSYEGIGAQLAEAAADQSIHSIVLDINSPGGEAGGIFGLAAAVRQAAAQKNVVAVVNDMAASAAYGIASGAREIVVSETSIVGSIGVVLLHLDRSAELAAKGVKPTLIHAGAHKVDGNPFEPLPKDVRERMQTEVDHIYGLFLSAVAAGRGARLDEAAARKTEARVLMGADAVARGLADRVGSFEEVVSSLSRASMPRSTGATRMDNTQEPAATAEGEKNAPAATSPAPAQAADEKSRVKSILTCEEASGRGTLAQHLALDTDLSVDVAKGILAKSPMEGASATAKPAEYLAAKKEDGALGLAVGAEAPKEANHGWSKHIAAANPKDA